VRIFTGAPIPEGADAIVIQENTKRDGGTVTVQDGTLDPGFVRKRGFDFREGEELLAAGQRLGARTLALAAAMGHGRVPVHRRPRVAIISTGDELVLPGQMPGPGQIVSSNHLAITALCQQAGAEAGFFGIARDTMESLRRHMDRADDADIVITIGGASVGDHDLVGPALKERGVAIDFWSIAMRPGKPLMFGRRAVDRQTGRPPQRCIGLPGNPVSSMICTRVFVVPLIEALVGRPAIAQQPMTARAARDIEANGPRAHYMRALLGATADGERVVEPVRSQDSSLLSPLASADCLIVRPVGAPAAAAGTPVPVLPLDF
jgi:molybdopterin molybdotransferase